MTINFPAYVSSKQDNHTFFEVYGLDFEQFSVGNVFHHRPGITIKEHNNQSEALDTANFAMLHYDQKYAQHTEWKKCLGVSTMTLQRVIGATWKTFSRKKRTIAFKSITMTHPVFDNDTLYSKSEIISKEEGSDKNTGILHIQTKGINQDNQCVVLIDYILEVYKKNKHPFYKTLALSEENESRFFAYKIENNEYKEQIGLFYEDFNSGEKYHHFFPRIISQHETITHSLQSLEWNPRYINPLYCEKYLHQALPINETYLISVATTATTHLFGRVVANLAWSDMHIERDVLPGEMLFISSKIMNKRESSSRPTQGIMQVQNEVTDHKNKKILSFNRTFLIYKNNQGPYEKADY